MLTIDASVYLNSFNQNELGSADSQLFLARVHQLALPVYAPTLLLVELAAACGLRRIRSLIPSQTTNLDKAAYIAAAKFLSE